MIVSLATLHNQTSLFHKITCTMQELHASNTCPVLTNCRTKGYEIRLTTLDTPLPNFMYISPFPDVYPNFKATC